MSSTTTSSYHRPDERIDRLPDVSRENKAEISGTLDRVGMSDIETRVLIMDDSGTTVATPAKADAFVRLDRGSDRGIHMSRLFVGLDRILQQGPLSQGLLESVLDSFLESHQNQTSAAFLKLEFQYQLRRAALLSDNSGWRTYPVTLSAERTEMGTTFELGAQIVYSSACPCSGALARHLTEQRFLETFRGESVSRDEVAAWLDREEGMAGCPHSQRSHGTVRTRTNGLTGGLGIRELIDRLEAAIVTVVQTAVKREDEQEFARLNAENLMFCEDAARRMRAALEADESIVDYWIEARHFESLHPHDAVSIATKGIPGGYRA